MISSPYPTLYLASQSPRRRELLQQLGLAFQCLIISIDEGKKPGEIGVDYVLRMAREKAEAGITALGTNRKLKGSSSRDDPSCPSAQSIVLGADTVVKIGSEILGKPRDKQEAAEQLLCLSGRTHQTLTAVVVIGQRLDWRLSTTAVTFRTLTLTEAHAYWATDKAGMLHRLERTDHSTELHT